MPTPEAHRILKDTFGYGAFRSAQEKIISAVLTGDNVLAVMPTGAGKSMCYQIPALIQQGLAIVVSPLVALMEDQVSALKLAGVAAETINSSRSYDVNAETWRAAAGGRIRLLYLSPERLMTERMLTALGRLPVTLIAVDEAHCISRWGQSFRPEYEALSRLPNAFPGIPITALTATADEATRRDIAEKLFGGRGRTFVSGFDRPNIRMHVVARRDRNLQMLDVVRGHAGQSGIIYCLSRAKVERAADFLNANGVRALPYHAGMEKADRAAHQDIFMAEPGVVMVATIAFGMGIDKPDVRFVIHTDLPGNIEAYYQEIGRAGRDGEPAEAHMFYGLDDIRLRRQFIDEAGGDDDHVRREHKRLDALIAYCEAPECRRRALLTYFGENPEQPCGNCDVCIDPPELVDGTTVAQMALAAVMQTGQRFGAVHLIDVLRGADTERIRTFGHDRLPAYKIGDAIGKEEWRSIIRQLVAAGNLQLDVAGHGGLSVTKKGDELSNGDGEFRYRRDHGSLKGKRSRDKTSLGTADSDLSPLEEGLLLALKDLRRRLASERGVPAYVVFPDRALIDMARKQPRDEAAFAAVHGVGAAKLQKFSTPFLACIAAFLEERS